MNLRTTKTGLFCYSTACERYYLSQSQQEGDTDLGASGLSLVGFDVETTGLNPKSGDRIVSIGAVKINYQSGKVIDQFSTLVNPDRDVGATFIHGITDEDVRNAPFFGQVYGRLLSFFEGALIVGHNLRFDEGFLSNELSLIGYLDKIAYPSICTLRLAQRYMPNCVNHKLESCISEFDIKVEKYHDATCDALASAQLLRAIVERADLAILVPQL